VHHAIEVACYAGSFEQHGHEYEERNGDQREAFHGAPHLRGDHIKGVNAPGEVKEQHRDTAQHKGQRQAKYQKEDQCQEEQQRGDFDAHCASPA